MKEARIGIETTTVKEGYLMVPEGLTDDEIIEYAWDHFDEIQMTGCDLEEEETDIPWQYCGYVEED